MAGQQLLDNRIGDPVRFPQGRIAPGFKCAAEPARSAMIDQALVQAVEFL